MWITRTSINNPVFATMVMVAITVLGVFSYARLKVEQMPDVNLPFVFVTTVYPGAAPEAVEADVTKPIEYAVNQVSGVRRVFSNSREGRSDIFVEFRLTTNVAQAMQDVRDRIAPIRPTFPRDVKDPQVIRVENENSQPVVTLAVTSEATGLRELTSLTDQTIVKALENLPGVARIDVNGRVARQILVQIKPDALTALGLGVDQVISAIREANQDVPAGRITKGSSDAVVRVEGKIKDPAQFGRIIVAQQGGGPVYLTQVAEVIDGEKEMDAISRVNGLTLPIAVVATFIALYAFGFTLNFLTLMALSLTIGLLIDDAIVVRENIVRHLAMGKSHVAAAREGTDEIGLAVMATTFAIVAVFVPIAFMSGIIGRFFFQFGVSVAVAVLVSLFVSFTLDPMLSSVWRDPPGSRFARVPSLARLMDRVEHAIDWMHRVYGAWLGWALGHRKSVIAIALVTFFGSFAIVPLVGTEFIPEADQSFISLRLNTPVGSSLDYSNGKMIEAEEVLRQFPEIALAMTTVGTEDGRNYTRINLKLVEARDRKRTQKDLERAIRAALKPIPGIELALGYDRPIWFNLLGPDPDTLSKLAQQFADKVAQVPGIADLETSDKAANPALSIRLNNDAAADLGVTVQQVGATIRPLLAGDTISYWLGPDGQNYEVNVQLSKDRRQLASDLGNLYLTTNKRGPDGQMRMVPLRQVAELVETTSPQIIKRQDLQRRIGIYANAEGRAAGDVGNDVQKIASAMELPPGYRLAAAGQQQDMQESFQAAVAALGLAIIFIYLILASQFASFLQPIAIMASLPFSLIGVFLALLLTGTTLNIFSIIGFIMLMGLVTKNAILLVDFANRSRRSGASLSEALLTAGQVRLRPIIMTTAAMIGGMLPLALGIGEGGETQAPMGRAIIGGVVTSTLLTLIVVPVIYTYLDALRERRLARRARLAAPAAASRTGDD